MLVSFNIFCPTVSETYRKMGTGIHLTGLEEKDLSPVSSYLPAVIFYDGADATTLSEAEANLPKRPFSSV